MRKQIILDERHDRFLKETAAAEGVSEGEVVRRALELLMAHDEGPVGSRERRERAAAEVVASAERLARKAAVTAGTGPYRWRRADAYEEREARWES